MPTKISWSVSATVTDGPSFTESRSREVEAYGKLSATVPAKDGTPGSVTIEVQPSDDVATLHFFAVFARKTGSYGSDLKFSVDGGVSDQVLDGALLLSGAMIGGLLGTSPERITFTNAGEEPADIEILVGRQATVSS